jgi:processive 1,2-diacylglycerol beta-glucosyltransferase
MRAAEAVEAALCEMSPDATVRRVDVLEMTNRWFRRFYGQSYLDLVNKAPHVLGYFYDLLDQPSRSGHNRGDKFRLLVEKANLKKLSKVLLGEPWDVIVNTHFLPAEIIASLRKSDKLEVPQVTVTTDFETHKLWVNEPCERYCTATEEGGLYLQSWGVAADRTTTTGIPVMPIFGRPKDRGALLAKHQLDGSLPIVLQLAGGFGVGPIEKLVQALLKSPLPLQIVTVCGRNEKLRFDLQNLDKPSRHKVKVVGFTTEMDELMGVADLIMSKPGGLTTSEALASGAVMAIVNPIPGQESRNSDWLLENGAAIKINNVATLVHKLTGLLENKQRLEQLRENVRRIARPRAAFDVVQKSLELAGVPV